MDFRRIREHRGTQTGGFEELCCQLAALEDPAAGSRFIRKGPGADQGLECYRAYTDGHEVGWQAKYFISGFEDGQVGDLADSLKRALSAHPQLTKFVVCLPVDLRDNRSGKKASEVQRYERWRKKSVDDAAASGRTIEIELWSASSVGERLGRDDPMYSGRARYWFDSVKFSSAWFRDKLDVQRHNLGERYSPESHVELPIHQALQAVARAPELLAMPAIWAAEITYKMDGAVGSLLREELLSVADQVRHSCESFLQSLCAPPAELEASVPLERWATLAVAAIDSISEALTEVQDKVSEKSRYLPRKDLFDLYSAVDRVRDEIASERWQLMNKRELVISGPGGIGKSHLVADFGHKQLDAARPFILVLSGSLTDGDPWEQIRGQLDLAQVTNDNFLGALDAAAEAADCRAVLAIDALNERHGIALWETRLPGFIRLVQKFPRLALVLTIRSTYFRFLPLKELARVVHPGFAGHAGAAAKAYLDRRGIARPSSPNLAREFENPLFLRTCCEYLDAGGLKQLPKGMDGVTALFDFYLTAVADKVQRELKLIPELSIPRKALEQFLEACAIQSDGGSLSMEDTIKLLEGVHSSGGYTERSLFSAFMSEGVITQDVEWQSGGTQKEIIRFTFEQLSDHLRAKRLISQINRTDVVGSFRCAPLAAYFEPDESWRFAGVIEALAVQLPEEFNLEIFDVLSEEAIDDPSLCDSFESSLAWRRPTAFTSRTVGWVDKLCEATGRSAYGLMLLVSTEPENLFNANWLHKNLWSGPMPQRDAAWSVFLAVDDLDEGGAVASLIDWAWEADANEVDEQRLWLATITLTWFLSTSNRAVRDRATKALVNLLSFNLSHAAALVDQFAAVDDPYITERLLAACYGAAMQGMDRARCSVLAASVWKNYFAEGTQPPLNLMARDYAFGVLLYAQAAGELSAQINLDACGAKFKSAWPLETVTEEDLKKYRGRGYGDSICSSTDQHGDFGHYTLNHWLHDIMDVPRTHAGSTTKELFEDWQGALMDNATTEQQDTYLALRRLTVDYRLRSMHLSFSTESRQESVYLLAEVRRANEAFKETLSEALHIEYAEFAEHFLLESTRMDDDNRRPSEPDHGPVRRWICERAHQLGWTEELFEQFERGGNISHDRMGKHRVERVGKKYQYIALAEAAARMTDNLAMCSWEDEGKLRAFEPGPRGRDMKSDLDPSLLIRSTLETGWESAPVTWWTPSAPRLPSGDTDLLLAWVHVESDLCNEVGQIEVINPDGERWLTVYGFRRWTVPGQGRRTHAEAWSRISCLVTALGNGPQLANELLGRHRGDVSRLWERGSLASFLGEHGWRDTQKIRLEQNIRAGIKTPYAGIVESLNAEGNSKDNSIDDGFSLYLPSSGVMNVLDLHLRSGKAPEYVDAGGTLRWQDPSLRSRGSGAGVVSSDYFLNKLASAGLEPVWVLAGEKNVYAGQDISVSSGGFGGRLYHTTAFAMDAGILTSFGTRTDFHTPSVDQLEKLKG
ncbi:hypothetical protein SOM61_14185 [Massilia sp. CFBP9012]|uniref:hypothetical protein n=1 Tax=Massilia sp. CFBP9012 TaxID=3096531 RepID=UPI002A6A0626|nr:hypothetical protein [Massilia sp. CFBP9012]MDY0976118.1 hypothetical protein [Massilia sp. CFBP9012]